MDYVLKPTSQEDLVKELNSANVRATAVVPDPFAQIQMDHVLLDERGCLRILPASLYKEFEPKRVVVGTWVTHLGQEHEEKSFGEGLDEESILDWRSTEAYIVIGNDTIHNKKRILSRPHEKFHFDWLVSRSLARDQNCIYVWSK